MEKIVTDREAPQRIRDVLQDVLDNGDRYVVERDGVPLAAVVPISLYIRWKGQREWLVQQMRESAERAGLTDDEAIELVEESKRAARISQ